MTTWQLTQMLEEVDETIHEEAPQIQERFDKVLIEFEKHPEKFDAAVSAARARESLREDD